MTAIVIPFPGKFRATAAAYIPPASAAASTVGSLLDLPCTCLTQGSACQACAGWKRYFLTVRQRVAQRRKGGR